MINPKTPVLVGSGQTTQKIENFLDAKNPIELMHDASILAIQDTGIDDLQNYIDSLDTELDKSKILISFVIDKSTPIKHKIKKENLLLFKKECNFSEKQYIRDEKEDNMLFEDYLKHFRGEIE